MAKNYNKGIFKPKHPEKYNGDPTNIIYRSLWELHMMQRLDKSPSVIYWCSEELAIPYRSPLDNRVHRYYPDFIVKRKSSKTGLVETIVIEVKPHGQISPPTAKGKKSKTYLYEAATYAKNEAKWAAAMAFCAKRGWKFEIVTEKDLYK